MKDSGDKVIRGVTESVFCFGGGANGGGGQTFVWSGPCGRHRNNCFPITLILCTIKSQMGGGQWGEGNGVEGGGGRDRPFVRWARVLKVNVMQNFCCRTSQYAT